MRLIVRFMRAGDIGLCVLLFTIIIVFLHYIPTIFLFIQLLLSLSLESRLAKAQISSQDLLCQSETQLQLWNPKLFQSDLKLWQQESKFSQSDSKLWHSDLKFTQLDESITVPNFEQSVLGQAVKLTEESEGTHSSVTVSSMSSCTQRKVQKFKMQNTKMKQRYKELVLTSKSEGVRHHKQQMYNLIVILSLVSMILFKAFEIL